MCRRNSRVRNIDIFKFDPNFIQNEEKYREIKAEILGENESSDGSGSEGSGDDSDDEQREC
jgi:pre-mRNA-splicing factor CWC22